MKKPEDAFEGEWDFDGSCAPAEGSAGNEAWPGQKEFSLGCFQWEKRRKGDGLKKGRVQYRVKGQTGPRAQEAFEKARAFCDKKNTQAARVF